MTTNDQMRALCEAATEGPWRVEESGDRKWIQIYGNGVEPHQNLAEVRRDDFLSMKEDDDEPAHNAAFIAACREWVPFALTQLDAKDARIKVLEEALHAADRFISNGIELGFIRMPSPDSNDPALRTPEIIREALKGAAT